VAKLHSKAETLVYSGWPSSNVYNHCDNGTFTKQTVSVGVLIVFSFLQEMADESKAQDASGKAGKNWRRAADKRSGPVGKTAEKDEHFLHAAGKIFYS